MKKLPYLFSLMLGILACGIQSRPPVDLAGIVNATLTAVAQNNLQASVPSATLMPASIESLPSATSPVTPEALNSTLSLDILRYGTYHSADWGEFQLSDGVYYRTPPTSQESPDSYATRLMEAVLYGDLNLDGSQDAIVFLATQNGGTGRFVEMAAVLNLNGSANNVSTLYLGDRVIVQAGVIQNGLITLNMLVQGPNDGACCPSQAVTWNFYLDGGQLIQTP